MNKTIQTDFVYEEEIKKSRFICHLKRVKTEAEAREFIAQIKKDHWKANHNCSAYTIGPNQEIQRSSDDGEPSGTAGVPMLEIFKKLELIDVCAVVTRYFGGIKLGAGGLIRAYAGAVNHAVQAVGLVEFKTQQEVILKLDYGLFDSLNRFIDSQNLQLASSDFAADVTVSLYIDENQLENFLSAVTENFNGKISAETGQKKLVEVPITV